MTELPDSLYSLPTFIDVATPSGAELTLWYNIIVQNLREEAKDLSMGTLQCLLLERIAYNYIVLRWKEKTDGFEHSKYQKEFNTFWLAMTAEFNRQLKGAPDEDVYGRIVRRVGLAVTKVVESLDPTIRDEVRDRLSLALDEAGI